MSQEDLDALLQGAVELATEWLSEHSEFPPFALAMRSDDGEIIHLEPEEDEPGEPDQIVAALEAGLKEGAAEGRYRATAIVADVTLEDDEGELISAAIHVSLEHAKGDPVACVIPYAIGDEAVELDDLHVEPGERVVFPEPDEPPN